MPAAPPRRGGLRRRRRLCRAADAPTRATSRCRCIGDGAQAMSLGERECTLQRRFQKLVEIAPSPSLSEPLRERTRAGGAQDGKSRRATAAWAPSSSWSTRPTRELPFVFIEANPRLQVEHTVTEEVTGLDLVQLQMPIAAAQTLACARAWIRSIRRSRRASRSSGASTPRRWTRRARRGRPAARWSASTCRSGPGVRVDTHGVAGGDALAALRHAAGQADRAFAQPARSPMRCGARAGRWRNAGSTGRPPTWRCCRRWPRGPSSPTQQVHTRYLEAQLPALLAEAERFRGCRRGSRRCVPASRYRRAEMKACTPGHFVVRAPMPAKLVQLDAAGRRLVAAGRAGRGARSDEDGARAARRDSGMRGRGPRAAPGDYAGRRTRCCCVLEPAESEAAAAADASAPPTSMRSGPTCSA